MMTCQNRMLLVYNSLPANFQESGPCLLAHAPSLSHSLSGRLTISRSAVHILLVSLDMLLTGNMPLILQVQRKTWPRFPAPRWASTTPTRRRVFNVPRRRKRLAACLHSSILELELIIEPLSIQRRWSRPRCLFHRSLNLCRSPNVHYSRKVARGLLHSLTVFNPLLYS